MDEQTNMSPSDEDTFDLACPHCDQTIWSSRTMPQHLVHRHGYGTKAAEKLVGDLLAAPTQLIGAEPSKPADTTLCPYCAEDIKAAAIKCKHCGEMLGEPRARLPWWCSHCEDSFGSDRELMRHLRQSHRLGFGETGSVLAERKRELQAPSAFRGTRGTRISRVGERTDGGLACPKCGGTEWLPKRSGKQKLLLGVASLAVKGSQVRCVTCGTVYKRG